MAKCVCSEAEVECKCGCGCLCVDDESIPIQDRCVLMCYKCQDGPKTSVGGIETIALGVDAFVGRFRNRRTLSGLTKVKFQCKDLPTATLALAFHKITGVKISVPASKLGARRTLSFQGSIDDLVKRFGLISTA